MKLKPLKRHKRVTREDVDSGWRKGLCLGVVKELSVRRRQWLAMLEEVALC